MAYEHGKPLKSLVLAAGLGTRLRPLTDIIPKPLATVLGVPLLDAAFRRCVQAGSDVIAVNTHHLSDVISHYISARYKELGASSLHLSHEAPNILGTGGALVALSNWWGVSPLLVYNGDILSDLPLDDLVTRHRMSENIVTMAVRPTPPKDGGRSIWVDEQGYVQIIAKKDDLPNGLKGLREVGFACAYVANPDIRDFLPKTLEFFDVILGFNSALAAGYKIGAIEYQGFWADIGNPKSLWETNLAVHSMPKADQLRLLGVTPPRLQVNSDDTITVFDKKSVISASAKIGRHARIENSVLFDDAVVSSEEVLTNVIRGYGLNLSF